MEYNKDLFSVALTKNKIVRYREHFESVVKTSVELFNQRDKNKPCCEALERMDLGWFKHSDNTRCMPYIKGHSDNNMYRVNNCPSCGKYIRDIELKSE